MLLLRHSCFVLISSFDIRASSFPPGKTRLNVGRRTTVHCTRSQHDRLPARGTDAHHGEFCTGQLGDVSDIFSRGGWKLRKFPCTVYRRVPASDFFVNRLAIGELICVTWRNIQPFSE